MTRRFARSDPPPKGWENEHSCAFMTECLATLAAEHQL